MNLRASVPFRPPYRACAVVSERPVSEAELNTFTVKIKILTKQGRSYASWLTNAIDPVR